MYVIVVNGMACNLCRSIDHLPDEVQLFGGELDCIAWQIFAEMILRFRSEPWGNDDVGWPRPRLK